MSRNADDRPRADQSSEGPARPGLREVFAAWAVLLVVATAILITYARVPPDENYNVDLNGLDGGLSRALVALNWPGALIGAAVLPLVYARVRRPFLAFTALALCGLIAVPGVIDQGDLDAKWLNALPAVGVLLVMAMTVVAMRESGLGIRGSPRGDRVRVGVVVFLAIVSLPWFFAEAGFYVSDVPLLGRVLLAREVYEGEAAVHLGEHHGFVGFQLVVVVLLLSRQLPNMPASRLRELLAFWLAGLFAYGVGNVANDGWLEQVVKRGSTSWELPSVARPAANWLWPVVLGSAAALYLGVWRRRLRSS